MRWTAGITMRLMALTRAFLRLGRTAAASLALIVASTVAAQAACVVGTPTTLILTPTSGTIYSASGGTEISVQAALSYNVTTNTGNASQRCPNPVEVTVTLTTDGGSPAPTT